MLFVIRYVVCGGQDFQDFAAGLDR